MVMAVSKLVIRCFTPVHHYGYLGALVMTARFELEQTDLK